MKKFILIEADINDGDYVTSFQEISEEDLENILPIIEAIKQNDGQFRTKELTCDDGGSNEDDYERLFPDSFDDFYYYIPSSEYGIHTITKIEIYDVVDCQSLLSKY